MGSGFQPIELKPARPAERQGTTYWDILPEFQGKGFGVLKGGEKYGVVPLPHTDNPKHIFAKIWEGKFGKPTIPGLPGRIDRFTFFPNVADSEEARKQVRARLMVSVRSGETNAAVSFFPQETASPPAVTEVKENRLIVLNFGITMVLQPGAVIDIMLIYTGFPETSQIGGQFYFEPVTIPHVNEWGPIQVDIPKL
jgi:hypothetical protein